MYNNILWTTCTHYVPIYVPIPLGAKISIMYRRKHIPNTDAWLQDIISKIDGRLITSHNQ